MRYEIRVKSTFFTRISAKESACSAGFLTGLRTSPFIGTPVKKPALQWGRPFEDGRLLKKYEIRDTSLESTLYSYLVF